MTDRWYYEQGGERGGPVPVGELLHLASQGIVRPEALLWLEGEDRRQAVVAQAALNFATLPPPENLHPSVDRPKKKPSRKVRKIRVVEKPVDESGLDPQTGAVVDEAKYRRWMQEQQRRADAIAKGREGRDPRKELADWIDREENRTLVVSGDLTALRESAFVVDLLRRCCSSSGDGAERLFRYLSFLAENRRKFYEHFGSV